MRRWVMMIGLVACNARPLGIPVGVQPNQPVAPHHPNPLIDACLHWTACVDQPRWPLHFTDCADGGGAELPWPGTGIAVTADQLTCMAAAGLDCTAVLDCVSTLSATDCSTPIWSCNGDTLTRCDQFGGSRIVTQDCAAAGLHCILLGDEARCGLAPCDPKTVGSICVGTRIVDCGEEQNVIGEKIGGVEQIINDCAAGNADCSTIGGFATCVGRGPACTFEPLNGPIGCDGDVLRSCDSSGHEEETDCAASGLHCVSFEPNTSPAGIELGCASHPGLTVCVSDANYYACTGTVLQYCDDQGNERVDCKQRGYSDCQDGHCVL